MKKIPTRVVAARSRKGNHTKSDYANIEITQPPKTKENTRNQEKDSQSEEQATAKVTEPEEDNSRSQVGIHPRRNDVPLGQ